VEISVDGAEWTPVHEHAENDDLKGPDTVETFPAMREESLQAPWAHFVRPR